MAEGVLPFSRPQDAGRRVGTVHKDGSITFAGVRYASLKEVPDECQAFRADVDAIVQWRTLYRAVDPKLRRGKTP